MVSDHEHIVYLNGESLTIEDVINIAEKHYKVDFTDSVWKNIRNFREGLDKQLREKPWIKIYGTNVGCGDLKDVDITPQSFLDFQTRYIKAHNCGTGKPLAVEVVRSIMVIRLNSFAKGLSAMREQTCKLMIDMLNRGVTPWILEEGSVGASGDLVPLAMMGAVLIGLPEAKAYYQGELLSAQEALQRAGLEKIELDAKEAMGLTNGSNFMAALAIFALRDAELVLKSASISAALSLEAIRGEKDAFSELINHNRPHSGQLVISEQMRKMIKNSKRASKEAQMDFFIDRDPTRTEAALRKLETIITTLPENHQKFAYEKIERVKTLIDVRRLFSAYEELIELIKYVRTECIPDLERFIYDMIESFGRERVQDRYSFRAVPQVHGAAYEALQKLREVLNIEINSATDNPLFFIDAEGHFQAKSGANFHGQPLATVIDYVKTALTSVGLMTDKRTFSLLDYRQSYGLPPDLAYDMSKGDTGLMITQYAGAGRAAESRVLATPASVMSISTSANQEDFVSMGSIGVLHLHKIIYNTQMLVGIEILCAFRALQMTYDLLPEHLRPLGEGTNLIYEFLHQNERLTEPITADRYLRLDMEAAFELVRTGALVLVVEKIWEDVLIKSN